MAKKRKVTRATKRRLSVFGFFSFICIFYFLFSLFYEVYKIYDLKKECNELNIEYKKLKKEAEQLEIEIDELNDPNYLAKYAREHYSYSKDGEYIIKLQDKEEQIEDIEEQINVKYIIVGIVIFMTIMFFIIIKISHRKNK